MMYHPILYLLIVSMFMYCVQREKNELFSRSRDRQEPSVRHRMSKDLALKQSSQLTNDLLSATRMIQDNTEKSIKTLDKLGKSCNTIALAIIKS